MTANAVNVTNAAEAYVYNQDVADSKKMREGWNAEDEDPVWYAGYGSNLSSLTKKRPALSFSHIARQSTAPHNEVQYFVCHFYL